MSMKAILLAAATAATLLAPAAAMAQDYGRHREDAGRYDTHRWRAEDRGYRNYGYEPSYSYGYGYRAPVYGYRAYRERDDRGYRSHDRYDRRDWDRR
ncbi:MAG TPA: hypothetical protein VNW53_19725 [Phenylobacterium sp.]|jgi:hypothetical protein|uniref:hypothetical protein n=1 Tax=Phenylobacterium sp. TaxID=1871053 RepID=UPI002BFA5377|nr:hypothetical protein [Phenylobacterium sp.]HXA41241.1 hypothetical protein [Phenylobacterium sp.]